MKKIPVGILGATGTVGQKLLVLLKDHPWFEPVEVIASEKATGQNYREYVRWREIETLPDNIWQLKMKKIYDPLEAKILFSCLDASIAGIVEEHYANLGHIIISNARNHRLDNHVPLVIPEINGDHIKLIKLQQAIRAGFIITNPNCVVVILALALFPIFKYFGLETVMVSTMQAISGAGYPGVPSMDILGNVIAHIENEEEKIATELPKIFGLYASIGVINAELKISAACNRVPVSNGHTLNVAFGINRKVAREEIIDALNSFKGLDLPSSPGSPIKYFGDRLRPQPLLDINLDQGMGVAVGNLRPCNILDWKCTVLGHNTIRGAAGAAILNAEYLVANGLCG